MVYFFFSSRRRHTRLQGDWSSDVCSSDLAIPATASSGIAPTSRREAVWADGRGLLFPARLHHRAPRGPRRGAATARPRDRKSVVEGKRGDLGGRRIIKKKKKKRRERQQRL